MHERTERCAREARQSRVHHPQRMAVALQRKSLGGAHRERGGRGVAPVHARPINIK